MSVDTTGRLAGLGTDRLVGAVAGAAGLAASLFVLFGPVVRYSTAGSDGTTTSGTSSGIDFLLGVPDAQFALFAWPVFLGAVTLAGAAAAWWRRPRWTAAAAVALGGFVVVGLASLGLLYLPAALLMLVAAVLGFEA